MEEIVKKILAEHLGVEPSDIDDDALLLDDLNLNPANMTDILEALREQANIEIPYEEAAEINTVKELIDLAEQFRQDAD